MRIGWATPFNIRSAIARYSRAVAEELHRRGHEIEILRLERAEAVEFPLLDADMVIHAAGCISPQEAERKFDVLVLNIGDSFLFHGECEPYLLDTCVVGIFHDATVAGLCERLEGLSGWPEQREPSNERKENAQLSLLAALSAGAVAHGRHYVSTLMDFCPGPVTEIPLCYPDIGSVEPKPAQNGTFVVTTVGLINSNKQPDRVIRALARSPLLRERAQYRLVGPIEEDQVARVTKLASELGLRPPEIFGWVSDQRLFELLSETHLVCCLRYPLSEGGSASLISAMYSARPVIVADAGSYAQVPDELVWKVSYGPDPADLSRVVEAIYLDQSGADARARRGKSWAIRTYSAEAYVEKLLPFLQGCLETIPVIKAARSLGATLQTIGGGFRDPATDRIAAALGGLFTRREGLSPPAWPPG